MGAGKRSREGGGYNGGVTRGKGQRGVHKAGREGKGREGRYRGRGAGGAMARPPQDRRRPEGQRVLWASQKEGGADQGGQEGVLKEE